MMSKAPGFEVSASVTGKDTILVIIFDAVAGVVEAEFTLEEVVEIGEALAKAAKEAIEV